MERGNSDVRWIVDLFKAHSTMAAVLVPAFMDLDTLPRQVKLFPKRVFIETESGYLVLKIDADSGQLQVSAGRALEVPGDLQGEPSVEPVFADLTLSYLDEMFALRCVGVTLYLDADSSVSANRFRALALRFGDERILFFDPFWPAGIRVGSGFEASRLSAEVPELTSVELEI